jgi:2'-5' RNA ligase
VPPANLHITIRFLGGVDSELVDRLADQLAATRGGGFEVEIGELGTFKRGRLVRVVWLGMRSGAEAATQLASRVEAACAAAGLPPEARTFQPHLTLARARSRDGDALPSLPDLPPLAAWRAQELVLYQSHLGRAGAVYEPLRVLRLD